MAPHNDLHITVDHDARTVDAKRERHSMVAGISRDEAGEPVLGETKAVVEMVAVKSPAVKKPKRGTGRG